MAEWEILSKDYLLRGVSPETDAFLRAPFDELSAALNVLRGQPLATLCPLPEDIFAAFRECPVESVRVVLLGQDPYPRHADSSGMSFSVPRGRAVPPSLRNIYNALKYCGLMTAVPDYGDLTSWAAQGVLLLNAALTTVENKPYVHKLVWKAYTDSLIRALSDRGNIAFILLGTAAASKAGFINTANNRNFVTCWGHPSPNNFTNRRPDDLRRFELCPCFTAVNEWLKESAIDWNSINAAVIGSDRDGLLIFTDGGAIRNGRADCLASWAVVIMSTSGDIIHQEGGLVPSSESKQVPSNNRGELCGILHALQWTEKHIAEHQESFGGADFRAPITIISDSNYAIQCITNWWPRWQRDSKLLVGKKNLDMIGDAAALLAKIGHPIQWQHIKSHCKNPPLDPHELILWRGNAAADAYCTAILAKK